MIRHIDPTDRSAWGNGPWLDEPDEVEFEHAGYACSIRRSRLGALLGYVAVPLGHPWHDNHYDCIEADVHGGLTF